MTAKAKNPKKLPKGSILRAIPPDAPEYGDRRPCKSLEVEITITIEGRPQAVTLRSEGQYKSWSTSEPGENCGDRIRDYVSLNIGTGQARALRKLLDDAEKESIRASQS